MAARTPAIPPIPIFPVPGIPLPGSTDLPGTGGNSLGIIGDLGGIGGALHGLSNAEKLSVKLLDPHTYVRMGEFAVGVILIGIGLFAALNGSNRRVERSATTIVRTGANLTPVGRGASTSAKVAGKTATAKKAAAPLTRK